MNILICSPDNEGLNKYRFVEPNVRLQKLYPEHTVDIVATLPTNPNVIRDRGYDLLILPVNMAKNIAVAECLKNLKNSAIAIIGDIDDYWVLPQTHPYYVQNAKDNTTQLFALFDTITTTTEYLAKKIRQYHNNVEILKNCISFDEIQFIHAPTKSSKIRIGWAGGSSHFHDLKKLEEVSWKLKKYPVQFQMCGFDTTVRLNTGNVTRMQPPPFKSAAELRKLLANGQHYTWIECEKIFTSNYHLISDEYLKYLASFDQTEYVEFENEPYKRGWSKNIKQYATCYNNFDLALAPLAENEFNACKSELKLIEAGAHGIPVIASPTPSYAAAISAGVAAAPKTNDKHGWLQAIKDYLNSPETYAERYGKGLYDYVRSEFNSIDIDPKRAGVYEKTVSKKRETHLKTQSLLTQ